MKLNVFSKIFFILSILFFTSCSEEEVIPEDPGPLTPYDKSSATERKQTALKIKIPLQSRKKWKVVYVDSHMKESNCGPEKAFDDNPKSHWHTEWKPNKPKLPHEIQIDMGEELTLCGFTMLPRQDKLPNGIITNYEFYVSNDTSNWGKVALKGSVNSSKNNRSKQILYFKDQSTVQGRYVRLVALKGFRNMPFTSLAEFNVIVEE
ncbi:MAG: discoidin domain-containing protein [Lentisphaerales bacterium]|nr:discoidin domain-containing protein [Lentisphaerales bacterium]